MAVTRTLRHQIDVQGTASARDLRDWLRYIDPDTPVHISYQGPDRPGASGVYTLSATEKSPTVPRSPITDDTQHL